MIGSVVDLDVEILKYVQIISGNPFMDGFMTLMSKLGDNGLIWIAISLVLLISKKHRKAGIMALSALVLSTLLGELFLKHLIGRQRPFADHDIFKALIETSSIYSFPSGHASSSFAVAGTLALIFRKLCPLFLLIAALVSLSRVYLLVHYPSDIIAGMILGLTCATIVASFYKRHGGITDKAK